MMDKEEDRMKNIKKVLVAVTLSVALVALGACGKGSQQKEASKKDSNTVVIGLDDTFVPMGFKDDNGDLVGFDVDLATAVFKEEGMTVKFQPIDWSLKETELENQTIDLIWNGYSKNQEREKKVLFSDTYMKNDQVLVTPKKGDITDFAGMKGKKLGAQEGSSGFDLFEKQPAVLKEIVADNEAILYASFNEAFIDLENGRIDGLLIDKVYADYYLNQKDKMSDYNIITGPFENEDYGVGARKDDTQLIDKVNDGLKKLQENGQFKTISEKWFGEDVSPQ